MNSLLIKANKKTLTKSQATFNRLIKKIEKMQTSSKEIESILNEGLRYYHADIRPAKEKMLKKLCECIPIFYSYYKHPRSKLSKNESEVLKELIQSLLAQLATYVIPQDISAEITEIISDIEEVDVKELIESEFDYLKKQMSGFAEEQGLNIDLSAIHTTDSKEELMAKFQKAIFEAAQSNKTEENIKGKVKKKTKQQLKKEQCEKEIAGLQRKGLSKIYKQLAKALHPDLELNPQVKAEKEALMKKLTVAYENQDLHTLLSLEITWMNRTASNGHESRFQEAE